MDPSHVNYLCSDDESIFDRNQRLLREYYKHEDRRHIQDNLSCVLDEKKEGKRKFLCIAAFPNPCNLSRAVPLDNSLTVTVAVVRARNLLYEALQYNSTITHIGQISVLLAKHGLEISPEIPVRVPRVDERSCHAPLGF